MAEGERIMSGYTPDPADVEYRELIHAILWDAIWRGSGPSRLDADTAMWLNAGLKRGIAGLAEKGRLVPPDADTRPEYAVRWPGIDRDLADLRPVPERGARVTVAGNPGTELYRRTVSAWNGWTLIGPWLPVPTTEES